MGPKITIDLENADFRAPDTGYTDAEIEALTAAKSYEDLDKIVNLEDQVKNLKQEIEYLNTGIVLLKQYISDNGLQAYGSNDLTKHPKDMTKEELRARNRRVKGTNQARSKEA